MSKTLQRLRLQAHKHQQGRCYYCSVLMWLVDPRELVGTLRRRRMASRLQSTAEHLVPRSEGGRDTPANIVAACFHCNSTRHKKRRPPNSHAYLAEVTRRVQRGAWHTRWVHEQGLIAPSSPPASYPQPAHPGTT